MITADQPQSLLGQAIKSVQNPDFEESLCQWLAAILPYDNLVALAYFQNSPPRALFTRNSSAWVAKNIVDLYLKGSYLFDPFYTLHTETAPEGVYRLSDISPDQFRRNFYYKEYYRNTSLIDEIGFVANPSPGISVHICLGREDQKSKRFSAREMETAQTAAPIACALTARNWEGIRANGATDEASISSVLIERAKDKYAISLSPRQAQIAILVLRGHSSTSIGLHLGISYQTVKVFRKQLYKKCNISSQAELFNLILPLLEREELA